MFNELTEQKLNSMYDDLSKEQMKLLGELKTESSCDLSKDLQTQKQLSLLNTLMMNTLRLRNVKKKIASAN